MMPQPNSSQTKAFFMITLWLTVKNPSLTITKAETGETIVTGISDGDLTDFLTSLSTIAEGEPDAELAQQLYANVLAQLTRLATIQVNVQLQDGSKALATISYAQALLPVHELIGNIGQGNLAPGQVADYDPRDGCRLDKIEGVTS